MTSESPAAGGALRTDARPRGVHLVGSVACADAAEVFRLAGSTLGRHLRRIPDGETGKRARWNSWTAPMYANLPGLELVPPPADSYTPWDQAKLVVDPADLEFPEIGFAAAAKESYGVFARLKREGAIPPHCRFQVCLPTMVAPMVILVDEGSRAAVEGPFTRRLLQEVRDIAAAVPAGELALQWDVCPEVGIWEGFYPAYFSDVRQGVIDRLVRLAGAVPPEVELGFHLCYGDFGHKHFMQPRDAGVLAAMSAALLSAAPRTVNWIHVPVPRDRDDAAYFAPLRDLTVPAETEYYLGLVHLTDGVEGTLRRLRAAQAAVRIPFGVATECGFGRRPADTMGPLMRLHTQIAAPVV